MIFILSKNFQKKSSLLHTHFIFHSWRNKKREEGEVKRINQAPLRDQRSSESLVEFNLDLESHRFELVGWAKGAGLAV